MDNTSNVYWESHLTKSKIIHGDCTHKPTIEDQSVDLIVTSPPYDIGIDYGKYDDTKSYVEYLDFSFKWLRNCYDWLKDSGRIAVNIPFTTTKPEKRAIYVDIMDVMQNVGFGYYATCVWFRGRVPRKSFGTWMSAQNPLLISPTEAIIIGYKNQWGKVDCKDKVSDITRSEFTQWVDCHWNVTPEQAKKIGHPAPFPIEIPRRCIKLLSFVGDVVLDPFGGSGSTLVASYRNNRVGISIELDKEYCELSRQRMIREIKDHESRVF
jgi:site-specific DNA-methyltransferase (adenine-specific)